MSAQPSISQDDEDDFDPEQQQAWSITARLAAISPQFDYMYSQEVLNLIIETRNLHPDEMPIFEVTWEASGYANNIPTLEREVSEEFKRNFTRKSIEENLFPNYIKSLAGASWTVDDEYEFDNLTPVCLCITLTMKIPSQSALIELPRPDYILNKIADSLSLNKNGEVVVKLERRKWLETDSELVKEKGGNSISDAYAETQQAWSITARLAAIPPQSDHMYPKEVLNLIIEARNLHPDVAAKASPTFKTEVITLEAAPFANAELAGLPLPDDSAHATAHHSFNAPTPQELPRRRSFAPGR